MYLINIVGRIVFCDFPVIHIPLNRLSSNVIIPSIGTFFYSDGMWLEERKMGYNTVHFLYQNEVYR